MTSVSVTPMAPVASPIFTGTASAPAFSGMLTGITTPMTDTSGTPGAATINTPSGRCAIAALAVSVVITSSIVTAASRIYAVIGQTAADATLLYIARIVPAAGSFTIFGTAASTSPVVVNFIVFN